MSRRLISKESNTHKTNRFSESAIPAMRVTGGHTDSNAAEIVPTLRENSIVPSSHTNVTESPNAAIDTILAATTTSMPNFDTAATVAGYNGGQSEIGEGIRGM